ncbi:MAG: AlpA family phage regulatory protein [Proteobacteria bacterium]|nr:AlpA family phage regulatory protein [Pseudomonadota bacterium]
MNWARRNASNRGGPSSLARSLSETRWASRATLYRRVNARRFPAPVHLGGHRTRGRPRKQAAT